MMAEWISGEAGTSDPLLRWDVGGVTKWSVNWEADIWHNVVYAIVSAQRHCPKYPAADDHYRISRPVP